MALSSAAIIAVYTAGYLRTAPAAATIAGTVPVPVAIASTSPSQIAAAQLVPTATATMPPAAAAQTPPTASSAASRVIAPATGVPTIAATTTAVPTATRASQTTQASAALRDGTYTGLGSSRHGSIQATVIIQSGKIVSAEITGCGTRYPCSKVAQLPGQVLARQSANVDMVSGATDSSTAYRSAVAAALAQAH